MLETNEMRYIDKEDLRKSEMILSFYVTTNRQLSTLELDPPKYERDLKTI